jgi:hypothetical protein
LKAIFQILRALGTVGGHIKKGQEKFNKCKK